MLDGLLMSSDLAAQAPPDLAQRADGEFALLQQTAVELDRTAG